MNVGWRTLRRLLSFQSLVLRLNYDMAVAEAA